MRNNPYLENMVKTAHPATLVVLLYDRAISSLKTALELMEKGRNIPEELQTKLEALSKTAHIIATLDGTLNFEKGGEIAQNLHRIYDSLLQELIGLSAKDNPETVRKMLKVLEDLRSAWQEVEKEAQSHQPTPPAGRGKVPHAPSQGLAATL